MALPAVPSSTLSTSIPLWKSVVVLAAVTLTLILCLITPQPRGESQPGVIMQLPDQVDGFRGIERGITPAEKAVLPSDTGLVRKEYESSSGDNIVCTIVLSGAEKRSIHRPEICLPGQGYTIKSSEIISIPLQNGHLLRATKLDLFHEIQLSSGQRVVVPFFYIYWFVGQNVVTPSHAERIWLTVWDRVAHQINHRWAYVSFSSSVSAAWKSNGKSEQETLDMMKSFIRDAEPTFEKVNP